MNEPNNNRANNSTPKRRLSYNINPNSQQNSPLVGIRNSCKKATITTDENVSLNEQNENEPNGSSGETPVIKRPKNFNSPKNLNDSFDMLQLSNNRAESRNRATRNIGRRSSYQFTKHKSAPLSYVSEPLNDISNQFRAFQAGMFVNATRITETTKEHNSSDSLNDLELLLLENEKIEPLPTLFGTQAEHEKVIKQSLEIDATCNNLIGDRSKQHILPVIPSIKHTDLYCISPETLVDVLNGHYVDQIDEYIIIDSRYPYEYDGGHISEALNIFTKDELIREMFIKRLNCKNSKLHKFPSCASTNCLINLDANSSMLSETGETPTINGMTHSVSNICISRLVEKQTPDSDLLQLKKTPQMSVIETDNSSSHTPEISSSNCKITLNGANDITLTNNEKNYINKRVIVIFHCEFSSERGPSLLRFLRNQDRALNEDSYPNLYYPELYLLEGGYKNFYENFKTYCYPQTYKPMLHAEHANDLKHFRSKAKSWEVSRYSLLQKSESFNQKKQHQLTQLQPDTPSNTNNR